MILKEVDSSAISCPAHLLKWHKGSMGSQDCREDAGTHLDLRANQFNCFTGSSSWGAVHADEGSWQTLAQTSKSTQGRASEQGCEGCGGLGFANPEAREPF